ncbi:hypothetical protein MTO96_026930 [Rhipicephalus appendiculatus]
MGQHNILRKRFQLLLNSRWVLLWRLKKKKTNIDEVAVWPNQHYEERPRTHQPTKVAEQPKSEYFDIAISAAMASETGGPIKISHLGSTNGRRPSLASVLSILT